MRQIEHVEGAAVDEKTFVVVAVKLLNLRGVDGVAEQVFKQRQARQMPRGNFFAQTNFRKRKPSIDLAVNQKVLRFGKRFQEKFVVGEVVREFLRDEIKFRVRTNKLVEGRRRSVFLPRAPKSKFRQPFGQDENVRLKTQPNPHQIIGQLPKTVHVKQVTFVVKFAPHHCRRVTQTICVVEKIIQPLRPRTIGLLKNIFVRVAVRQSPNFAAFVDEVNPRETGGNVIVRVEILNLPRKFVKRPKVVRMVNRDVLAACRFHRVGNRRDGSAIFFVQEKFYPRVVVRLDDFAAVIGRAVVDNQQLKVRERLIQDAFNRRTDIRRVIVTGQHHADGRKFFGGRSCLAP